MKAHSLHEKQDYDAAIKTLKSMDSSYAKIKNNYPEYYLHLGELLVEKGSLKESFDCFAKALDVIPNADTINSDEKKYLSLYAARWLTYLSTQDKSLKLPEFHEDLSSSTDVNYRNVSKSIKTYFPLLHSSGFEQGTKIPLQ